MPRFERILFPIDFSERSRAAAPFVLSMAQRYQAKVIALHVLQPPPPLYAGMNTVYPEVYDFDGLTADLRQEVQKFTDAELPKVDVTCVVETGDPTSVIMDFAENGKECAHTLLFKLRSDPLFVPRSGVNRIPTRFLRFETERRK